MNYNWPALAGNPARASKDPYNNKFRYSSVYVLSRRELPILRDLCPGVRRVADNHSYRIQLQPHTILNDLFSELLNLFGLHGHFDLRTGLQFQDDTHPLASRTDGGFHLVDVGQQALYDLFL